jgi:hypothetical protein
MFSGPECVARALGMKVFNRIFAEFRLGHVSLM